MGGRVGVVLLSLQSFKYVFADANVHYVAAIVKLWLQPHARDKTQSSVAIATTTSSRQASASSGKAGQIGLT